MTMPAGSDENSGQDVERERTFQVMVERGLADSDAKRVITNDEMARRIRAFHGALDRSRYEL